MGLGLAIAWSIVERHSSTLTVSSAGDEKGSTFPVTLQRASFSPGLLEPFELR